MTATQTRYTKHIYIIKNLCSSGILACMTTYYYYTYTVLLARLVVCIWEQCSLIIGVNTVVSIPANYRGRRWLWGVQCVARGSRSLAGRSHGILSPRDSRERGWGKMRHWPWDTWRSLLWHTRWSLRRLTGFWASLHEDWAIFSGDGLIVGWWQVGVVRAFIGSRTNDNGTCQLPRR